MKYEDIRRQVLTAIRQASAQGLIHGTSGNISVRDREAGVAAITPSGRPYDTMEPGDIAIVTLDGEWVDGPYAPSSETPMHTAVYRARPDVGAVNRGAAGTRRWRYGGAVWAPGGGGGDVIRLSGHRTGRIAICRNRLQGRSASSPNTWQPCPGIR